MTIDELIENQICPPWIMKSKPILGRCVPSITEEEYNDSDINKDTVYDSDVTANKHETGDINKDNAYDSDATPDKLNFVDHSADILKHSKDAYGVSDGYK